MPLVVWPVGFPQQPKLGLEVDIEDNIIESAVDSGPAKQRRRTTQVRKFQTTSMELTGAQLEDFDTFWTNIWNQSGNDAGTFTWINFHTGASAVCRFKGGQRPKWTLTVPALNADDRVYQARLELEIVG